MNDTTTLTHIAAIVASGFAAVAALVAAAMVREAHTPWDAK